MAVSTVITSSASSYTKTAPIPFTITFGADVTGFEQSDIVVTNGEIVSYSAISGSIYDIEVNPASQNSEVSIFVPADVAEAVGPDPNSTSNTLIRNFKSEKAAVTISHSIPLITDSRRHSIEITFETDVVGLTPSDFEVSNCTISDITGSGSSYTAFVRAIVSGEFSFYLKANSVTDIYDNTTRKSKTVTRIYDADVDYEERSKETNYTITDPGILLSFQPTEIRQVAQITSLVDCAKNIEQRLLDFAIRKAYEIVLSNPNVQNILAKLEYVQFQIAIIQELIERVQGFIDNPETLLNEVLQAYGLTGPALTQKLQNIADKYSAISGLDTILDKINQSGICGVPNFYSDGRPAPSVLGTPTNTAPPQIFGVNPIGTNTFVNTSKDEYDAFTFKLKENYAVDPSVDTAMITTVTNLVMGYHDKISKTTDSSTDEDLKKQFLAAAEAEKQRNSTWSADTIADFDRRISNCAYIVNNEADVIRAFYNKSMNSNDLISVGITTYSGPDKDFTTFLDIKPSERPPELTSYWTSRGYNIEKQEQKLLARGIKTGTLSYSDAYLGAYGPIVSDKTVASTRVKGGSIVQLKNKDGSIYDPTGKNPTGIYTVMDTGNANLTYKKFDVFTSSPELYKDMSNVHVYLVKEGSKTGPQYARAQRQNAPNMA